MTKRLLALILALVMCLSFAGCGDDSDKSEKPQKSTAASEESVDNKESTATPVLYKATGDNGNVVWLFGSIHVGRDDYYPLSSYVMDAYNDSDALAVEFDIVAFESDMKAQTEILTEMLYVDGTKISDHIKKDTYDAAVKILEENKMYNEMFDYYIPAMWSSLIDNCLYTKAKIDINNGIDKHLLNKAKTDKKEILEVESAQLQYSMLKDFSPELSEILLEQSIESYNNYKEYLEELNKLQDAWVRGNEKALAELVSMEAEINNSKEELTEEEIRLLEEYYSAMITERNESMTQYAVDALDSDKEVFICVGAAHILGDGAIAENLKDLGYKVERVK